MRCSEAKRLMQMTLAGDSTGADRGHLHDHIASCPRCEGQWEEISKCVEAVHTAAPAAVTIERNLANDVVARLGPAAREKADMRRGVGRWVWSTSAAASVLCRRPVVVGAAVVLVALLVSVLLLAPRPSSDFAWADVVEAMQRVEKAYITGSSGDMWYLRGHGWRWQTMGWEHAPSGRTMILTPEALWLVSEDHATLADPNPRLIERNVEDKLTAPDWMALMEGPSTEGETFMNTNWRVIDDVLDGMPVKRLDFLGGVVPNQEGMAWIDPDTKRVLRYERWKIEENGNKTLSSWWAVDYDSPVDPSLFAYEPPPGMRIQDSRLTARRRQAIEGAMAALVDYPDEVAYLEHLLAEWLSLNCFFDVVETEDSSGHKLARVWSAHFSEEQIARFESEPDSQFFTFDLNEKKLVEREVKHRLSLPCPSSCRIPGTHTHPSHEQQTLEHIRIEYDEAGQPHIVDLKVTQ